MTDGFTGNVFLKTAEGIAAVVLGEIAKATTHDCPPPLKTILGEMRHRLDYSEYPGAILCGVDGIVIKCHGSTPLQSLRSSLSSAVRLVEHSFLEKLSSLL